MTAAATITWLVRYGHVVGGALWLGSYAVLAFLLIPALARGAGPQLERLTEATVRVLTYSGMGTIFFGLLLVTRTRGFDSLPRGEWGGIIITCILIAVALLGRGCPEFWFSRRLSATNGVNC